MFASLFANILQIAKISGGYPANIYLFKSTIETLEKGVKYVKSWQ